MKVSVISGPFKWHNLLKICVLFTTAGFPFSEFSRTSGFLLPSHDDKLLLDLSTFDCLVACVQESAFVCHSVDHSEQTGSCRLSRSKVGDGDTELVMNHAFNYYERLIGK